jgi:hypothetical protein
MARKRCSCFAIARVTSRGFAPPCDWLDLLADFAFSVPREHICARAAMADLAPQEISIGGPSFFVLVDRPPRYEALVSGGVVSVALLAALALSLVYASKHVCESRLFFGDPQPHAPDSGQSGSAETAEAANVAPAKRDELDPAERRRVIEAAIQDLKQHYVSPDAAQRTADSLLAHEQNGDDDRAPDANAKGQRRSPSRNGLQFNAIAGARRAANAGRCRQVSEIPGAAELHHREGPGVRNNIGYLKLNSFPEISVCQQKIQEAMNSLNGASAIIFDLRDNRGGFPETVAMIAAYFFDHPEYLFNPRENTTERSWTRSPIPGNRLADKPVYILTSSRTLSGAEQFTYNLKMLKRATIVGEKTGGAAHAGVFYRIDDHFGVAIPESKPINPFGETDWEGKGVDPDVQTKAADALETAERLADKRIRKPDNRPPQKPSGSNIRRRIRGERNGGSVGR